MTRDTTIATNLRAAVTLRAIRIASVCLLSAAPVAAQSPRATDPCTPVSGSVMTNFLNQTTTLGTATGDLEGAVSASLLGVVPGANDTVVFTVQHHWTTTAGDSVRAALAEATATMIAPGLYAVLSYPVTITGGTGRFEGATGTLSNIGAVDLGTGRTIFRYQGSVCFKGTLR